MTIPISMKTHEKLMRYVDEIQKKQQQFTEFREKLRTIDEAYAKTRISLAADPSKCTGAMASDLEAIKVPVVNSEIDSIVAFLSGIFVNRSPLFPVISDKATPELALKMQALISRDARQQRWGRRLLSFLTKSTRYNIGALEIEPAQQKDYNIITPEQLDEDVRMNEHLQPVIRLHCLDLYNSLFDYRVEPADISTEGEYAGYNAIVSKVWLKTRGNQLSEEKIGYNLDKAYASSMDDLSSYWNLPPDIATATHLSAEEQVNWFNWAGITDQDNLQMPKSSYFYTKLYVRIVPADFGIGVTKPSSPRIIRLEIVNNKWIISYKEIITPMDMLPIFFSDMREDGFKYQTKSPGETVMPYQDTATELLHTRLEGSKRALSDRAIYDSDYLNSLDVNAPTAAAKIPLKKSLRNAGERPLMANIYHQIPFEGQGVVNALTDLQSIMALKDQVNGIGMGMRGEHRPGNRTLGEYTDVENSSRSKGMPYAIRIEEQVMAPLKLFIKFYILTSPRVENEILDVDSQSVLNVNIPELRKAMLDFRVTDGLLPKSAIRDPSVMSTAIQFMQNNQELAMTYDVGGVFADLMAIFDFDISKHKRTQQDGNQQPATGNSLQSVNPNSGGDNGNS